MGEPLSQVSGVGRGWRAGTASGARGLCGAGTVPGWTKSVALLSLCDHC